MPEFDDPMAQLRAMQDEESEKTASQEHKKSARTRKKQFHDPLDQVSFKDAAKATKSSVMVGNMAQRTVRLPPEYLTLIRKIAEEEIMSIADAERWVVGRGLIAYFEDGERPKFEKSVHRQVHLPRWEE